MNIKFTFGKATPGYTKSTEREHTDVLGTVEDATREINTYIKGMVKAYLVPRTVTVKEVTDALAGNGDLGVVTLNYPKVQRTHTIRVEYSRDKVRGRPIEVSF